MHSYTKRKIPVFIFIFFMIFFNLTVQLCIAADTYIKVIEREEIESTGNETNPEYFVQCDSYDNESIYQVEEYGLNPPNWAEPEEFIQYDQILSVTVLCPTADNGRLQPMHMMDNDEGDWYPLVDLEDNYIDQSRAYIYCRFVFGNDEFYAPTSVDDERIKPKRVYLQCLDHSSVKFKKDELNFE